MHRMFMHRRRHQCSTCCDRRSDPRASEARYISRHFEDLHGAFHPPFAFLSSEQSSTNNTTSMKFLYYVSATLAGLNFALAKTHHVGLEPIPPSWVAKLNTVVRYTLALMVNWP